MVLLHSIREELVDCGFKLIQFGLIKGRVGNFSARDKQSELIAISPSRMFYDKIEPKDIVVIDKNGTVIDGKQSPSSEFRLHLAIYNIRKDVGAIVHTHSPSAIAFSLSNLEIDLSNFSENLINQKKIPITPKEKPGTQQLADQMYSYFENKKVEACVLGGHGLIVVGQSISHAIARACFIDEALLALIYSRTLVSRQS